MKQLRSWHLSALKVISGPMSALARTSERDGRTRTTIENCAANESWTRTKYRYDSLASLYVRPAQSHNFGADHLHSCHQPHTLLGRNLHSRRLGQPPIRHRHHQPE